MVDNTNRHFRGQQKNEEVISFFRAHPIVLVDPIARFFIAFTVLAGAAWILFRYVHPHGPVVRWTLLILMIMTIGLLHWFFLRVLNYFLQVMIITNYRLIRLQKTIFLSDDKHAIDLGKIQDVTKQQNGILQTFLDFGSLAIIINMVETPFMVNFVPKPDRYFRRINIAKHEYISRYTQQQAQREHQTLHPDTHPLTKMITQEEPA